MLEALLRGGGLRDELVGGVQLEEHAHVGAARGWLVVRGGGRGAGAGAGGTGAGGRAGPGVRGLLCEGGTICT